MSFMKVNPLNGPRTFWHYPSGPHWKKFKVEPDRPPLGPFLQDCPGSTFFLLFFLLLLGSTFWPDAPS